MQVLLLLEEHDFVIMSTFYTVSPGEMGQAIQTISVSQALNGTQAGIIFISLVFIL